MPVSARYGESVPSVRAQIESLGKQIAGGLDRQALQGALGAGAARNALDCAFWDLEAKRMEKRVWELARLPAPKPLTSAYTLSLDSPEKMRIAAKENTSPRRGHRQHQASERNRGRRHCLLRRRL